MFMETYDPDYDSLEEEMSQSEMKAKEELENLNNFAGQLHDEKEFVDVTMHLQEGDMDKLAKFLGHDIRTHR